MQQNAQHNSVRARQVELIVSGGRVEGLGKRLGKGLPFSATSQCFNMYLVTCLNVKKLDSHCSRMLGPLEPEINIRFMFSMYGWYAGSEMAQSGLHYGGSRVLNNKQQKRNHAEIR